MNQQTRETRTPLVQSFFDSETHTITHVVGDPETKVCAVIDSVLDYEPQSGTISTESVDRVIAYIRAHGYTLAWILETHVHADHLTAAQYLKKELGGSVAMGDGIISVQKLFGDAFYEDETFPRDGSQFDTLFKSDETFSLGSLTGRVLSVPGHTPADMAYLIGDALFVGDTLFMPDYGSARCDFPGGSAQLLHDSVAKIFSLPEETRVFLCHDYLPEGRDTYMWETTIRAQRAHNVHLNTDISKDAFVNLRTTKDATLGMPKLIIPSIQVNMRAGHIPRDTHGNMVFKIPVNGIFSKSRTISS